MADRHPFYLFVVDILRLPECIALAGSRGGQINLHQVIADNERPRVAGAQILRINHWPALLTAALSGAGITLQPAEQVREHIAAGRLLPLLGGYQSPAKTLYFIYPAARRQVLKITLLGDFLAESLQAEPEPE
ncbi:LysR substrate-binding domain-containing protein [Aeromonas sobria]|uniref:LysR substrate-binding domain-containing protein n=1 Tax=Aeromonas sobria TaxID=646 RepID=UPI0020A4D961|nr:LysR substrate-binding domain-containing protein [Aeromonas sobria]